mgnify:CR=1 FL=1
MGVSCILVRSQLSDATFDDTVQTLRHLHDDWFGWEGNVLHALQIDGGTTADGLFTVAKCECLGACADAPVMLVNDRQMVSFMSNDRLDELVDALKAQASIKAQ